MRAWGVVGLLVALALAGCSEDAGRLDVVEDDFDDVEIEVTSETGAILGVVVNDAIVPVPGALVKVLNTPFNATTDVQGRFAFSRIDPGTYFLSVSKPFHEPVQASVEVKAGVKNPPVVKVQLNRVYKGDPYMQTIANAGFFTCTQAGMPPYLYSSSPCHSIAGGVDLCALAGACLDQIRDFHADVAGGWQTQIWEMTWEPSASGTSERMGIVVSTYKPTRNTNHWFAQYIGTSPLWGRLDCGPEAGACTPHPTAQAGSGPSAEIPPEGIEQMSYFVSVRASASAVCVVWCVPPGIALDQKFDIWLSQFYYLPAPEGWSFLKGDPNPFG